jgi:quinolinate synthase
MQQLLRRTVVNRLEGAVIRRGFATAFPSLKVHGAVTEAQGSFAQNIKSYSEPDKEVVDKLDALLEEKQVGVVSHYYMDAELQGTLAQLKNQHVFSADSLAMGHAAVGMAKAGVKGIVCLGVDFMSESVRATLDQAGCPDVPVYRCNDAHIGCSLAEAAERDQYYAWLGNAAKNVEKPLHVVYINTSIESKARAVNTVPTITCTSSNVVYTVLQAAHDIPGVSIFYGPDTYMGRNLYSMFSKYAELSDEEIARIHPEHNKATLKSMLERFHYYKQGMCVVHHMFGEQVVNKVRRDYPLDGRTFYTAHLEVPGEMFELGFEAQLTGDGVVGSTSNILNFIISKTQAVAKDGGKLARFILGTEVGMVTSIVNAARELTKDKDIAVEIIFPVDQSAVTATDDPELAIVPGVSGGEGCSTSGGCASCPFMKMNDLDSLVDVVERVPTSGPLPKSMEIRVAAAKGHIKIGGSTVAEMGGRPIGYMNYLMTSKSHHPDLIAAVSAIGASGESQRVVQSDSKRATVAGLSA